MQNQQLRLTFAELTTALVADACLRLDVPVRVAPTGIRPLPASSHVAGAARPVRHLGSVDVFFEAMGVAGPGDVLVIDNGGRTDEGCIGDLTVLEAHACGLAGVTVWGCHRDTAELERIGFPVFSYGACPAGPRGPDGLAPDAVGAVRFGEAVLSSEDVVFADADGVLFAPGARAEEILATAARIRETERRQAAAIRAGKRLRDQLRFDDYLAARAVDPGFTFRRHLRAIGGAIEE